MFGLSKLLRAGEGRTVKRLAKIADQVMALDDEYSALTDAEPVSYTHLTLPTICSV